MIFIQPPNQRRKPDPQQVREAAAGVGLVLPDVAVLALQQGRVIEAIKLIRTANPGLDLARAKALMQRMQAQAHTAAANTNGDLVDAGKAAMRMPSQRPPTVAMGDPPGQLRWVLLVAALIAAAVWIAFGGMS